LKSLDFSAVDGLGFAMANGQIHRASSPYSPRTLGPLLELFHLAGSGRIPDPVASNWLAINGAAPMVGALHDGRLSWSSPDKRRIGFLRTVGDDADETHLSRFLMQAQCAAREIAGLPGTAPGQTVAAMEELEGNIREHSGMPSTGLLAYRAAEGIFEFVAADKGVGLLESLRSCRTYAGVPDHGRALQLALDDGVSRFEDEQRGHGFRPIFVGLANLNGSLRFRSGDHALLLDGTNRNLVTARTAQKPMIDGFFVSVCIKREGI
jgi:hypothetical protein